VIRDLMATVDRDHVIMTHDSGSPREQLLPMWETTKAGSYMGWGKSTQLGYGLALNMGAKLAAPDKLCVNIMGDAAFGMTGLDIETAARNNIATLTIVFNNHGYNAMRKDQESYYPDGVAARNDLWMGHPITEFDYAELAKPFGAFGAKVESPAELPGVLEQAFAAVAEGRSALLNVLLDA